MNRLIPRFYYYQRLSDHMAFRKELKRDNKSVAKKLKTQSSPFLIRWEDRIKGNPKKSIFAMILFGLFCYYDGHGWIARKYQRMEPIKMKLQRWIFKVNNKPHPALNEMRTYSKLKPDTIDTLREIFLRSEQELKFGMSRKYLFEIYDQLELFKKKDDKQGFYRQSGYYRKRNQRICSVHYAQFITLFEDALAKLRKTNPALSEDEFLTQFVNQCNSLKEQISEWEYKFAKKRVEYKKLMTDIQERRSQLIKTFLFDNPYISEEEVDQKLTKYGIQGLSIQDKLVINKLQLSVQSAILDSYKIKMQKRNAHSMSTDKDKKLHQKLQKQQRLVDESTARQEQIHREFRELFKKSELL